MFKAIDGKEYDNSPAGFCHYGNHKGYVTYKLIKEHNCLGKNCPYLEKNLNHPQWHSEDFESLLKKYRKRVRKRYLENKMSLKEYRRLSGITNRNYVINYMNTRFLDEEGIKE